ncbi:sensor domain-containing diguanylate cyclase [Stenotrophomonas acidaminiphila]|uniref:sensor domain-containing diguanylate cyclase n=1 Tax=Stenotrophomonas acidaminiphila TaxID=128780 RepID=UPI003BF2FDB5
MDLRKLIVCLAFLSAFIPFVSTINASYGVQRKQLIDSTLDSNFAYAKKLSKIIDEFLLSAQLQLSYAAGIVGPIMDDPAELSREAARLRMMSKSFSSIVIFDDTGRVLATSPQALQIQGKVIESEAVKDALRDRRPLVSEPYLSSAGNFILFVTSPIFSSNGKYLGAVGGAIYLQRENVLHRLLGQHFYEDGSYIYVVDQGGRIIYHPNSSLVGSLEKGNAIVDKVSGGHSGRLEAVNSKGVEMLAGYAAVPSVGWGVVAQRPKEATLAPLTSLMQTVLTKTLPIAFVTLVLLLWSAKSISRPLRQLADGARNIGDSEASKQIRDVRSWYFEARELKKALLVGLEVVQRSFLRLREDTNTDPLTKLGNRRRMQVALDGFQSAQTAFSVLSIDIDRFKIVNDTFGHDAGDVALKFLADRMVSLSRACDVPLRVGGEEFSILLPSTSLSVAANIAERLRADVEKMVIPVVGGITISIGVANWPETSTDVESVFKVADQMLYSAKRDGRNRVAVSGNVAAARELLLQAEGVGQVGASPS